MLFTQWYLPLCNYAYSILRNEEDAKDMAQKTFYKLWDQRSVIEIHTSIKSYLYRMVHNDCLNKIKERRIRTDHHQYLSYNVEDSFNDAENLLMERELQQQIEDAIESLPPRCREIFRMSRVEYYSYSEIAEELSISVNTVETQMVKALRILREKLADYLPLILLLLLNLNEL